MSKGSFRRKIKEIVEEDVCSGCGNSCDECVLNLGLEIGVEIAVLEAVLEDEFLPELPNLEKIRAKLVKDYGGEYFYQARKEKETLKEAMEVLWEENDDYQIVLEEFSRMAKIS